MKKIIFPFMISAILLVCLYLSAHAESTTIDVPATVNYSNGTYIYTFNQRISATTLHIFHNGVTTTLTTTETIIDISNLIITSTVELTLTGSANSITMIESDDPEFPYIIFSSIEDLRFHYTKYFSKIYLPTVSTN